MKYREMDFVFSVDRKPDMLLGDPVSTFWDTRFGKPMVWNPSFAKSSHFEIDPFLQKQTLGSDQFDMCGKTNVLPRREFIRANNEGSHKPPPLSYQNQFMVKPRGFRQILEPKQTQNFDNVTSIPNFAQKFIPAETPMEELQKDFLRKNVNQINSSENRKDRDGLLDHLRQSGNLEQTDLQKPISSLIEKIHKTSSSDDPFLGDPLFEEIKARNRQVRAPTTQDVEQARKVEEIKEFNKHHQSGVTPADQTPANPVPTKQEVTEGQGDQQPRRIDFDDAFDGAGVVKSDEITGASTGDDGSAGAGAGASRQPDASAGAGASAGGDDPVAGRTSGRQAVQLQDKTVYVGRGGAIFSSPNPKKSKKPKLDSVEEFSALFAVRGFLNKTGIEKLERLSEAPDT